MELSDFSLFANLDPEVTSALAGHIHYRNYSKKTQIITEGDESHCVYFVFSGRVKVFLDDEKGKEIIVHIHEPGEFFGELGLIHGGHRTASVVTLEESRLGLMSEADFRSCLRQYPDFSMNLIHHLADRLCGTTETIRQLGLMDVYGRIAVTFLNLSEENGSGERVVKEKLTQQNIANRVGASREMVARILKDLRTGEYIDQDDDGHIIIRKALPHSW